MRPGVVIPVTLLALVTSFRAVAAQAAPGGETPTSSETQSKALIAQGLELRREGKASEALELFRRAHALAPSPRALGQLGLAEASVQLWLEAETHLAAALAITGDAWVRRNQALIDAALIVVRTHVGELSVSGPAGTDVSVDGRPVGPLPHLRPTRVAAGHVLVAATGNGFKRFTKTVLVQPGARTTLAIVLDPVDTRAAVALAPPTPLLATTRPGRKSLLWAGGTLLAVGAGLLTWGTIRIALDDRATGDRFNCGPSCTRVYATRNGGWLLAGGGAAVLATGAAFIVIGRRHEPTIAVGLAPSALLLHARF